MADKLLAEPLKCLLWASMLLLLDGCGPPASVEMPTAVNGDPDATKKCWETCRQIKVQHNSKLSALWLRDFRPSAVSEIFRNTVTQLRECDTDRVNTDVIEHINSVIAGMNSIAEVTDQHTSAKLRDEFLPVKANASGLSVNVGGSRQLTGAGEYINATTALVNSAISNSEANAIRHCREVFAIELRPW